MQQVAGRRLALTDDPEAAAADPSRDPSVLAAYRQRFSWAAAGARYRARLEELWGAAAGAGGAVEVVGGVSGLREAGGRCPPQALGENRREHK
jgi:hypothetical protein